MANHLSDEKSPYLLQHADNPVDWYPWGDEALERARREDRPILVSIGYSACHWCHVMAHESFEDPEIAGLMNDRFVNIKVDREERPDVDGIYMEAVQALTGQGGWPLNVFLLPDGRPFYGGTYFPPQPRYGMPSWAQVLEGVSATYRTKRDDVLHNADALTQYIRQAQNLGAGEGSLSPAILETAYRAVQSQLDWTFGGFGKAPKFPQAMALDFLLRMYRRLGDPQALRFVQLSLDRMAAGGIFDHLGGGFHRYSVDRQWVVPHFEKMLYDNALLARTYLQAYQLTGEVAYRGLVEATLDYLLRELRSPEGGFYSAEDADSEGVEGKYYVWTPEELAETLTPDQLEVAQLRFGVTPDGNFEGKTILTVRMSIAEIAEHLGPSPERIRQLLEEARDRLLAGRSQRVPPGKDTKILTSWNGLAIRTLAEAGRVLGRPAYLEAACRAADFVLQSMRDQNGRLVRSYRDGPSEIAGFLEDYAFLIEALVTLYETAFDRRYLQSALELAHAMTELFGDENGGFFDTSVDADALIVRPRSFFDNPIPSGNSAAAFGLLRLEALTGDASFGTRAESVFRAAQALLPRAPLGFAYLLSALDFYFSRHTQIAIAGDVRGADTAALVRAVYDRFLPNKVVAVGSPDGVKLLEGRESIDGRATAYVCENFACRMPVTDVTALEAQLDTAG